MDALFRPSKLEGVVKAPQSKSIAIRLLFSSLIGNISLDDLEYSEDVKAGIRVIQSLGVRNNNGKLVRETISGDMGTVDIGGSGTVLRMLLPILSIMGISAKLTGDQTLQRRPLGVLHEYLTSNGVEITGDRLPLRIHGRLDTDTIEISGSESSQYISGFIFGLLLRGGGKIVLIPPVRSSSYISMTCHMLNSLGASINYSGNEITVNPLEGALEYSGHVPGDFLLSSFYAIGAVLTGGKVSIQNLKRPEWSLGDSRIAGIVNRCGGSGSVCKGIWSVESGDQVLPFHESVEDSPDMAVSLAALAFGSTEQSQISGVELLRIKESDRITSISETLRNYGSQVEVNDILSIRGPDTHREGVTGQWRDHRIAMLGSVLSLVAGGKVSGAESVSKSNPGFFDDLRKLGGDFQLI